MSCLTLRCTILHDPNHRALSKGQTFSVQPQYRLPGMNFLLREHGECMKVPVSALYAACVDHPEKTPGISSLILMAFLKI